MGEANRHLCRATDNLFNFLSCTDSGKKIDDMARNRSLVSVHLLHEPSPGFDEINLPIVEVKAFETATVQL
jgi:hypothetical protein